MVRQVGYGMAGRGAFGHRLVWMAGEAGQGWARYGKAGGVRRRKVALGVVR